MKRLFSALLLLCVIAGKAQHMLRPESNPFDKKWLQNGKTEMGYYVVDGSRQVEICSFTMDVKADDKTFAVYTTLQFLNSDEKWIDTSIAEAKTFTPVYRSCYHKDKEYVIKYGKVVSGYYIDRKNQKKNLIKEPVKETFFDSYTYPYLLSLLPLDAGYKTDLMLYDYQPANNSNITRARLEEVKSNIHVSSLTGKHEVWQVSVLEEATNDRYQYYIDKKTRRIWKVDVYAKGQHLLLVDKEIDYNPFTTRFDKDATLKLIKEGSAVISGQVFARDNQARIKGIAIFNVNKKQYAKNGTSVILIPYTDFFKEWINLNNSLRKKGRAVPLPAQAAECIKVTTVYDDEGHFEFVNLMPGDYLLYTEFSYVHTGSRTEVVGYTDTYINGMFQGSYANTNTYSYDTNAGATVKKVVTIEKKNEKAFVKLKKTL